MADPVTMARMALLLGDEQNWKRLGWAVAAVLSPIILVLALLCVLGSGAVSHNISAAQLCFGNGEIPAEVPAEYRVCIEQARTSFAGLDQIIADIQSNMDDGSSRDATRIKAVFFSLYFGSEAPPLAQFAHCFVTSEIRTRTVTEQDEDGNDIEVEQIYTVFTPITDLDTVYSHVTASLGVTATEEQKSNADNVYSLIKYGYPVTGEGGAVYEGADVPYVGADGFCSLVGANWRSIVTSEFGGRLDPITGQRDGHTGGVPGQPGRSPTQAPPSAQGRHAQGDGPPRRPGEGG